MLQIMMMMMLIISETFQCFKEVKSDNVASDWFENLAQVIIKLQTDGWCLVET